MPLPPVGRDPGGGRQFSISCFGGARHRSLRRTSWRPGPKGERIEGPGSALNALARELEPLRGSASG